MVRSRVGLSSNDDGHVTLGLNDDLAECKTCARLTGLPGELEAELEEVSRELLASLQQQACVAQSVCSGLSGQAAKAMDTAMAATDAAGGQANDFAANTRQGHPVTQVGQHAHAPFAVLPVCT